ncbi:hypothetical protein ACH4S8_37960 [Streptomyces sp. NPDC021080]
MHTARTTAESPAHDVYGGEPGHPHEWTWTLADEHGHMGFTCPCGAFRP